MERLRRQRSQAAKFSPASKVTTIVERSQCSDDKLTSNDKPLRGNHNALKKLRTAESDSSTCGRNRTTLEDQLAADLGRTISPSPPGNLMRSLLKDEMLKETESRRRAPSVIAKLMGLDRMPSQNSSGKQSKKPSDSFHGQTVSAGISTHRKSCKNQSCRKIAREQDQFKDVYEVRESLKGQVEGYASHNMPLNRKHTEDEMDFIRKKFMDAKRLSTDEKLQDSKEFHDAIDVLNSNNHLFLKLLQEPDSLFAKHLHDFHASQQSRSANVRDLKASKILDYNIKAIGGQAGRQGSQKIDISFSRHISHRHPPHSDRSVTFPAEGKEATSISPTKIVLLKPNNGRSQKTPKSFSSSSPCDLWSDVEMRTTEKMHDRHGEAELWGKKRLPVDLDFSTHRSRESREVAKEITQQMKTRLGEVSFDVSLSGCKGYSADESSHDMSGTESDTTFLSSQTPFSSSFRGKSSSSCLAESSVSKEGKKRLSERWNVTHSSQEIRMEKGTTLGEMLSMPDWDIRSPKLDRAMAEDGSSGRFDTKLKLAGSAEPLGISSKDGWKNGSIRSLPRSRSLPNTFHHVKNQETHMKHEVLGIREAAKHSRKKAASRNLSLKEGSSTESRRLSDNKPDTSHCTSKEMGNDEEEDQCGSNGNKSVLGEKDSPENRTTTLEAPTCRLSTILKLDSTMEVEHESSGDDLLPDVDLSTDLQLQDESCSSLLHESAPQNHAAEPGSPASSKEAEQPNPVSVLEDPFPESPPSESSASSKEAEQPSPVSVLEAAFPEGPSSESSASSKEAEQPSPVSILEAPFPEDPSSGSECFERVSADLHGLRMQLQLLKLESNAYDEGSLLISSDEEDKVSSGSLEVAKAPTLAEAQSWQALYTTEVLAELELEEDMATWSASECPVGPWVFDKLEKKYNNQESICSRPDRKLLFERIKDGITEIGKRSVNPHPWVKKTNGGCRTVPKLRKVLFEGELWKLLEGQATCAVDVALLSDEQWIDLGMHIDAIGREIGKMVFDDLIAESMVM